MADYHIDVPQGTQEIIITRHINAPREVVFRILTDPMSVPEWWGPDRYHTSVNKMMVMPGGTWRYIQTDKEGNEYGFHGVYHDVVIPERLVYTSEFEGMPGHVMLYIDMLKEEMGKTIITTLAVFQSVEDRDQMVQLGMEEGVSEMTRRMNELLVKENLTRQKEPVMDINLENDECITITRTFSAPREEVWERWKDPNQYMCWWGPKDFTSPYAKIDLRTGGSYLSCMRGPDGKEYWDTGKFEEIDDLNHIIYTDTFADEHGNPVAPSYYGLPGEKVVNMAVQVDLEDIGGKTRLTLQHCGLPGGEMLDQAKEGWNQSFDKLAECLR